MKVYALVYKGYKYTYRGCRIAEPPDRFIGVYSSKEECEVVIKFLEDDPHFAKNRKKLWKELGAKCIWRDQFGIKSYKLGELTKFAKKEMGQ